MGSKKINKKDRNIMSLLWIVGLVVPLLLAAGWSILPFLRPVFVAQGFDRKVWEQSDELLDIKQKIQKHFLSHQIYLPLEDMLTQEDLQNRPDEIKNAVQKICGQGKIFVWVPLTLRLPIWGDTVWEWCWKPKKA